MNNNNFEITQENDAVRHDAQSSTNLITRPQQGVTPVTFRQRQQKKRGVPVFYIAYTAFVVLFIIAAGIGLVFLNSMLAEYESVQPKYKAEEIFEEYFAEPDIAELIGMSSTKYAAFESQDKIIEYLAAQIKDKEITYSESSVKDESGNRAYNVLCGDARFAIFSIGETDEVSEHGFTKFGLKDIKLTFSLPENSYSFLIPEGYTLLANGVEVGEKYIAAELVPSAAYTLTEGRLGIRYVPYTVDGFLSAPTFEVKDRNGETCEYAYDEQSSVFKVEAHSAVIKVPEGYTPYLGETAVGTDFLVADSVEASVFNAFIGEGVPALNYVTYKVEGFLDAPSDVVVRDKNGADCRVSFTEGGFEFESMPSYDKQLEAENATWIRDAFRTLTRYIQYIPGTSKADVRVYFDTTSETWKSYNSIPTSFNYEATSHTFEDESVTDFVVYDEDHFSCHVKLHYIGRRGSTGTYEETTDQIVFFKKVNGKYLIYNMSKTEALSGLGIDG